MEELENEAAAVHHLATDELLEVLDLSAGQVLVEDHQVGPGLVGEGHQVGGLAAADERPRVEDTPHLHRATADAHPGALGKRGELLEVLLHLEDLLRRSSHADEQGAPRGRVGGWGGRVQSSAPA
jgi:hypothetical protein